MFVVKSAGLTDVGKKRKGNEDSLFLDDSLRLYIVSDGMGGLLAGEIASKIVVDTIQNYIQRFKYNKNKKNKDEVEELEDSDETLSKEANRLLSSISLANRAVYNVSNTQDTCRGMGATLSAVYFTNKICVIANVGDSPIYLVQSNAIELISVMHTVMAEFESIIENQDMNGVKDRYKHMLTRAMGIEKKVDPDICEIPFLKGDMLVMCSDGLSDKVTPDEIYDIVKNKGTAESCKQLVSLANDRGGDDNITVIVIKNKGGGLFTRLAHEFMS